MVAVVVVVVAVVGGMEFEAELEAEVGLVPPLTVAECVEMIAVVGGILKDDSCVGDGDVNAIVAICVWSAWIAA